MPSSYFLHSVCRSVFPTFPHPTHQPSKPPSQTQQPCRTPLLVVAAITPWWPMVPASRRQEVDLETSASSPRARPPHNAAGSCILLLFLLINFIYSSLELYPGEIWLAALLCQGGQFCLREVGLHSPLLATTKTPELT
jgi:hypothetical protein